MIWPLAGHAQPLAERVTGLIGVLAGGAFWGALVMGGGVGTGVVTTGAGARGVDMVGAEAAATLRGARPSKRIC